MVTAIIALVTAIVSGAFAISQANKAQYEARQAEYQGNINFARQKELSYYGMFGSQERTKTIITIAGFVAIAALVLILTYKKK